jgi:hypothetical protein
VKGSHVAEPATTNQPKSHMRSLSRVVCDGWRVKGRHTRGQIVVKDITVPKRKIAAKINALDAITRRNNENFHRLACD